MLSRYIFLLGLFYSAISVAIEDPSLTKAKHLYLGEVSCPHVRQPPSTAKQHIFQIKHPSNQPIKYLIGKVFTKNTSSIRQYSTFNVFSTSLTRTVTKLSLKLPYVLQPFLFTIFANNNQPANRPKSQTSIPV